MALLMSPALPQGFAGRRDRDAETQKGENRPRRATVDGINVDRFLKPYVQRVCNGRLRQSRPR